MDKCARCDSTDLERGQLMVKGLLASNIRFQRDGFWTFRRRPVAAVVCLACGHVELRLAEVPAPQPEAEPGASS